MRRVVVEANVRGRDLGGFVERGAGAARAAREGAAVRLLRRVRRAVREPAARHAPARHRRADRAPAHHGPALHGARLDLELAARAAQPAVRAGRRRDRRRRLPHAALGVGGGRLHRAAGHRGAERRRAGGLLPPAPRAGRVRGRDGAQGLRPALPAAAHDRAHELHRPPADALRDRLGRGHPEAARRGGDGRARHLDAAHAHRAADHLCPGPTCARKNDARAGTRVASP